MRTRRGVQNCRTRDAAHTSHLQLKETMNNTAGSNEQHNDITDESTNSSEQQYVSMGDRNADKSDANINISETPAVDEDIESNTGVVMRLIIIPGQKTILL